MATKTAAAVPQVPGAGLMKPTPPAVANNRGRSGTRDHGESERLKPGVEGVVAETTGARMSGIDIKLAKATFDQFDECGNRLFGVFAIS